VLVDEHESRTRATIRNVRDKIEETKMVKSVNQKTRWLLLGPLLIGLLGTAALSSAVEVGEKAPDFKLPSTNGVDISLSEFRGKKWVFLEFYGADFAPT
jgi:AhpC/TSA family protein